jgi:hypothetical protein
MITFIVRLWTPGDPESNTQNGAGLRGVVEQVDSGSSTVFVGETELLDFISERTGHVTRATPEP